MSTEEPQKRVVRWKEYAESKGTQGIAGAVAYVFLLGGMLLLIAGIPLALLGGWIGLFVGAILSLLGLMGIFMSKTLFDQIEKMEPVALLTKENAKHLPEIETLVRAADLPPSDQQAELLRAAPQGSETSSEELLRPSVTRDPK